MELVAIGEVVSYVAAAFAVVAGVYKTLSWLKARSLISGKEEPLESESTIGSRFIDVFEAHGVHRNQIPEFFGHNLTLADVQTEARLLEKLTPEMLTDAANLFLINSEWLAHGQGSVFPVHRFYKEPVELGNYIDRLGTESQRKDFDCCVYRSNIFKTGRYDALIILKTPVGVLGERFIYAYHLCPEWLTHYWKSSADLACCISQVQQRNIHPHGNFVDDTWLSEMMSGACLPEYDYEAACMLVPDSGRWNPSEFADTASSFIEPLKGNRDNFSITSALDRWLSYYDRGDIYVYTEDINLSVGREFREMAKAHGLDVREIIKE